MGNVRVDSWKIGIRTFYTPTDDATNEPFLWLVLISTEEWTSGVTLHMKNIQLINFKNITEKAGLKLDISTMISSGWAFIYNFLHLPTSQFDLERSLNEGQGYSQLVKHSRSAGQ